MQFKKKFIVFGAIIFSVLLISVFSSFKLFFIIKYSNKYSKQVIIQYFKKSLNKAIKVGDLYIDCYGNIVISDFNISITSDFNDNISFVKSEKTTINLDFFDLFIGKLKIKGVDFYNSDITFLKKYGKSHIECLNQVFDLKKFLNMIRNNRLDDFNITFHNANVFYKEFLKDKKLTVELNDIFADINIEKSISYRINGYIKPFKSKLIDRGWLNLKGFLAYKDGVVFENFIEIQDFDLSYLNDYIKEHKLAKVSLKGGGSTDLEINNKDKKINIKGEIETSNLNILYPDKKYSILSNENINMDIDLVVDMELNSYKLRKLELYNDVLSIMASGEYIDNKKDKKFKLDFRSNKIDLFDLSHNLTLVKDLNYSGSLDFSGNISLDIKNNLSLESKLNFNLENFVIEKYREGKPIKIISECNGNAVLKDKEIRTKFSGRSIRTDFLIKSRTLIRSWIPFKSDTHLTYKSKNLDSRILYHTIIYGLDKLLSSSYKDRKKGFENIFFLQKPIGKFVNNNNITVECSAANILFGKKARLNDFIINLRLERGVLSIDDFNLNGYDAAYSFGIQGFFHTDQPFIVIKGSVNDFNLGNFIIDRGMIGLLRGTANLKFKYELSAYRLSHIIDNSKGSVNLYISNGILQNSRLQKRLNEFFRKNGYNSIDINNIDFTSLTLSVALLRDNFWFRNCGIKSDTVNINSHGRYIYNKGINLPLRVMIKDDNRYINIPLKISGPLLSPCMNIYRKKGSKEICF